MYRGSDSVIRDVKVAPKRLLGSLVVKKKNIVWKAARVRPMDEEKKSRSGEGDVQGEVGVEEDM